MPSYRPSSPTERGLHDEMCERPLDPVPRRVWADWCNEHDDAQGAEVIHGVEDLRDRTGLCLARPDHLFRLRRREFLEGQCATVVNALRALLAVKPETLTQRQLTDAETVLSVALGRPKRGDALLNLLDAKTGKINAARLREQYDFQITLLASLDLLDEQDGCLGITGIDEQFHPLPPLDLIRERLQTPEVRCKVAQGFNQLLFVPFALPLLRLIGAWRRCLLRNEHLLPKPDGDATTRRLDRATPVWVWQQAFGLSDDQGPAEDGRLVYFPHHFTADHGGRTKREVLAADAAAAWQVLLTEGKLTNLSRPGRGNIIAGRRQSEGGSPPTLHLAYLPVGESGWTPETYATAFLTTLERSGKLLDRVTITLLTASYLPASGDVPSAYWFPVNRQACLGWDPAIINDPYAGARAAVRVI